MDGDHATAKAMNQAVGAVLMTAGDSDSKLLMYRLCTSVADIE